MYEKQGIENVVPGFVETVFSYPDVLRVRGTVIFRVLPQVFTVTAFATGVASLNYFTDFTIQLPSSLIGPFSVVLGLLLVFRSDSANESFLEGRRVWSDLKANIRNATRLVWFGVMTGSSNDAEDKVKVVRHLTAFAYATKHFLRRELGVDYDDLRNLLSEEFIEAYKRGQENARAHYQDRYDNNLVNVAAARYQSVEVTASCPSACAPAGPQWVSKNGWKVGADVDETRLLLDPAFVTPNPRLNSASFTTATNLPLPSQILFKFNKYIFRQSHCQKVDSLTCAAIVALSNDLGDNVTQLERILLTPMPLAYRVHLKQSLYLYLFLLPFTLVNLGFLLVPVVAAVAFTLFGIDGIGREIENPFGYDLNDLALDDICDDLREEAEYVIQTYPLCDRLVEA
ncbi:hypothetical protein IWQ60_005630 [Tieghemiomyces parasiticus]|uniref:Uncharacterized protein n=1 Tax=Tieghemiomyces parasiticus TaxID=78921 RepID=A0A9W8DUG3_9FUNG|nr:hypothetical protein IWQ60_005630 [Tieghemiomyces parasiticus]